MIGMKYGGGESISKPMDVLALLLVKKLFCQSMQADMAHSMSKMMGAW